ncbi:MAG: response regulator [Chitinophagaceae bacterium]
MSKVKKICLIDDDEIFTFLMKRSIVHLNIASEVMVFPNGEVALAYFEQLTEEKTDLLPDLVLLDINMPLMDGWEFIEAFENLNKSHFANTEIYIASSSITSDDREKAATYTEIKGYLNKPIEIDTIIGLLQKN